MAYALSGSHRTGKTTLAKQVASDLGIYYHDASTSKIIQELGVNAVGDLSLETRIEVQEKFLERYLEKLTWAPRPMITDRTPLDMIGYMLGELTMHNCPVELGARIEKYAGDCINATIKYFDTIILLGPLPLYTVDPKSPPPNVAYQSMVQFIVEGAATQVENFIYVERLYQTDFQLRRQHVGHVIQTRMSEVAEDAKAVVRH